jgi:hypothetical protein
MPGVLADSDAVGLVLEATAKHFGSTVETLVSRPTTPPLDRERKIAMYVARTATGSTLRYIGGRLGGRDETTVLLGERAVENRLAAGDTATAADVREIMERLRIGVAARVTHVVERGGRPREEAETIGKAVADRYVAQMLEKANIDVRGSDARSLVGRRLGDGGRQFLQNKGKEDEAKIETPDLRSGTAARNDGNSKIINGRILSIAQEEVEGARPERQTRTRMLGETAAAPNTEMPQLTSPQRIDSSKPETVSRQGLHGPWTVVSTELSSKAKHEISGAPGREVTGDRTGRLETDGQVAHYRDLDVAIERLSAATKLPHTPTVDGEFVAGTYREDVTLSSGRRFAVIDNGLGFTLVPWSRELDRHRDRHVTGVAQESGGIEWSFGRKRGLEI